MCFNIQPFALGMYIEETAYDTSVNRSTEYSKSSRQFFSWPVLRVYTFAYQIQTYIQRKWPQKGGGGGEGGSSVGRARDFWWGGPGFDSRCDRQLPTGWVGVSIMWPAEIEAMVSQLCLVCGST